MGRARWLAPLPTSSRLFRRGLRKARVRFRSPAWPSRTVLASHEPARAPQGGKLQSMGLQSRRLRRCHRWRRHGQRERVSVSSRFQALREEFGSQECRTRCGDRASPHVVVDDVTWRLIRGFDGPTVARADTAWCRGRLNFRRCLLPPRGNGPSSGPACQRSRPRQPGADRDPGARRHPA